MWRVDFPQSIPSFVLRSQPSVWHVGPNRCDHHHVCTIEDFRILYAIFWHAAFPLRHRLTSISNGGKIRWGEHFSPIKTQRNTSRDQVFKVDAIAYIKSYPSFAPDSCAICNMLWLLQVLPPNLKTERSLKTNVLGYGTLLIEQASSVFNSRFKEFGNLRSLNFSA